MNIVFDLDGTLANLQHRLHFIQQQPKNWPEFYRHVPNDVPIVAMVRVAQMLMRDNRVEIWSGRSDVAKDDTRDWLLHNGLWGYNKLRMRKDGDYRKDCVVKEEWLLGLDPWERPDIVFDDRKQVIDMWRSHGIHALQVAEGDF